MKAYWGSECIAPLILWPRHYMEVSGQLHAPAALPQGKSPCYSLYRRLGGPESRSGRGGEEESSQSPPGIEHQNPDRPARSPALHRLNYHGSVEGWLRLNKIRLSTVSLFC
jgi:hypothetical protein